MIKKIVIGSFLGLTLIATAAFAADDSSATSKPRITVNRTAKIRGNQIILGEISDIRTDSSSAEELATKLKGLVVADAPPAGGTLQLMGQRIIDTMNSAKIDLGSVYFSIPPIVFVQREGRKLSTDEVLSVAQTNISAAAKQSDVRVNQISWDQDQVIPLGQTKIAVEALGDPAAGKLPMRVTVTVDAEQVAKFLATAVVDDWRAVPVLNKPIERGMLISETDFELVRANMAQLAPDVASTAQELIGRAAKSRIAAGETVRRSMIDIPPIIAKGSRVNARFVIGALTASGQVLAMEDGVPGGAIKVRNESSNKVFKANVIDEKTVEVK